MKVLVVDDDNYSRKLITYVLEEAGHSVCVAEDGQKGVDAWTREQPDLVLMDLMMPVMDGWQVLEKMAENPGFSENKVITISAVNLSSRMDAKIPKNTVGRLSKPIALKSVLSLVEKYCGKGVSPKPRSPSVDAHP